jgi:hypothetical protein
MKQSVSVEKKSNPPYLLGLLCLIPLIGAFVGLALLLYGIFKYKDKWLSIIGALGIGITVFVYGWLFYAMKNYPEFTKGFMDLSQIQLNSLTKNIEFFKIQHGYYPDSLKQVLDDDKSAPVVDPLQISKHRDNLYFNYQKVGDKYYLFSSGADGMPNTKDDFDPKVSISDSTKIGLIGH